MLLRLPPYLEVYRRRRHHRYLALSCRHLAAAAAEDCHPTDLWIAKLVSTVFLLSPSPSTSSIAAERLGPLRHLLTPSVTLAAVRRLPDPRLALGLFDLVGSALGVVPSAASYRFVVGMLCSSDLHDDALKVFDQMTSEGHCKDGAFVEFLAISCIEAGKIEHAIAFIARASEVDCVIGSYTFNKLLRLLVDRNRVQDAIFFFREHLQSQFFVPDTCSFNVIMKGLCRSGDSDVAFKLFKEMETFGCLPDTVTHNILIDGLCRAEEVDRAHEVLQTIQMDGSCVPNVITYTSIISAYCKVGKMEEAYGVFDTMISSEIKPSRVTYNVLINGHAKAGDMSSAISVYERMLVCGCPPDIVTFTSLIDGYCRSGQLDDAMKIWDEMKWRELKPNAYTFSVVINAFCKRNRLSEAMDLLKELNRRMDIAPHAFIYNPVIDGLCKAGDVNEANVIFLEMEKRCSPDKFSYTILIIGLCTKGRMLEAISLFHRMVNSGCPPDSITVSSLVSCLLKAGMPNEANQIMIFVSGRDFLSSVSTSHGTPSSDKNNMDIAVAV